MSEQVFKSPGFFEREIEIQTKPPKKEPNSSPVGIIGPTEKGPAFVPVILNSMDDYKKVFGEIQKDKLAGHAVAEFFNSKSAPGSEASVQFIRTLGIGSDKIENDGTSPNAGFVCDVNNLNTLGGVQLLAAEHKISENEKLANGMFSLHTDNQIIKLIRAMFFLHKKCKLTIINNNGVETTTVEQSKEFILKINCTDASIKSRSVTVSLDPSKGNYIAKVLNTDPFAIDEYGYVLYLHFPIDSDFCDLEIGDKKINLLRGNTNTITNEYGNFQSRFNTPKTTKFISQPFGSKEYDLFHFETIDDGSYAAAKYKISISNLRVSTDVNYKFGTFNIELRDLNDTDENPIILEGYSNCSLDPSASNYIAKLIGDQKTYYNIDVDNTTERRIYTEGENPNQSNRIRIVMSDDVRNNEIPDESLPFGFRGIPVIRTSDIDGNLLLNNIGNTNLNTAILPPLPYRLKITSGRRDFTKDDYLGQAGFSESVNTGAYWGLMNFNIDSINIPNNRATSGETINKIIENYCKFMGLPQGSTVYDLNSSEADEFNYNKFTLARVGLSKTYSANNISELTSSVTTEFKEAVYIRDADYNNAHYTINSQYSAAGEIQDRITLATILSENKDKFNKYSAISKFTAPIFGGFDGLNIFDKDSMNMNDRASSTSIDDVRISNFVHGKACNIGFESALTGTSNINSLMQGTGFSNNIISAYTAALDQMLETATATIHVLVLPGIREPLITNYAARKVEEYGKAIYLMDLPHYSKTNIRLYDEKVDENNKPDVTNTISGLNNRNFDNNYVASYFPDVMLEDASDPVAGAVIKRTLKCPSSIVALGALAKSEGSSKIIQPWFAPAGFENGLNTRIKAVNVRLRAEDRDDLYEARINPIATFPSNQYVIFGQKTLQVANTALSRVNVRRLMIEVKRGVERHAQALLFEPNSELLRNQFLNKINGLLSTIQKNSGIENFRVTLSSNDSDSNNLNGQIIIVPTRVVEFIAMDFVITNSGVIFN